MIFKTSTIMIFGQDNISLMDSDTQRALIARNLKYLMRTNGLTQKVLSARAEVSQSMISNLSNCRQSPTVEILNQLAKPLRTSAWKIISIDMESLTEINSANDADAMSGNHQNRGSLNSNEELLLSLFKMANRAMRERILAVVRVLSVPSAKATESLDDVQHEEH